MTFEPPTLNPYTLPLAVAAYAVTCNNTKPPIADTGNDMLAETATGTPLAPDSADLIALLIRLVNQKRKPTGYITLHIEVPL